MNAEKHRHIYTCNLHKLYTLLFFLPESILVDAQVSGHYFSSSIPHAIDKEAPCGTQSTDKEVRICCHQEIYERIVCTGFPTKTRFIYGHCHVSHLACHVRVVKVPMRVKFWFINHFLKASKTRSYKRKVLLQHMQMLIKGERAGEMLWKLTCISVESQMLLRCGKCFLMRSARSIYFSNSTTFISHALSPILTCMLSIGLGIHGLWLDQTKSSISDLELFATSWHSESSSRLNFVEGYSWLACQN